VRETEIKEDEEMRQREGRQGDQEWAALAYGVVGGVQNTAATVRGSGEKFLGSLAAVSSGDRGEMERRVRAFK